MKVNMREEQNIIHLSAASGKELQREMNEEMSASADVQYDNIFFVMPNEKEKTIMILPSTYGSVLKLGIKEAGVLAEIIQSQIQKWK